jgi:hypothetical protein
VQKSTILSPATSLSIGKAVIVLSDIANDGADLDGQSDESSMVHLAYELIGPV